MVKKKTTPAAEEKISRQYRFPQDVIDMLDKAKKTGFMLDDFVGRCILEYGDLIITQSAPEKPAVTLKGLHSYLLEAVDDLLVEKLTNTFTERQMKAHKALLKKVAPKNWAKFPKKLREAAKNNELTADTKKHEWQALIRALDY